MNQQKLKQIKEILNNLTTLEEKIQTKAELYLLNNNRRYSGEYYNILSSSKIEKQSLLNELKNLGIEFDCEDYGGSHCLNINGLKMVLRALEN